MFEGLRGLFTKQKRELAEEEKLPYERKQQEALRKRPQEGVGALTDSTDKVIEDIDAVLKDNKADLRASKVEDERGQKESAEKRGFFGTIGKKGREAGRFVKTIAKELRHKPELRKEIAKRSEIGLARLFRLKGLQDIALLVTGKGDIADLAKGMIGKEREMQTVQDKVAAYSEVIKAHRDEFVGSIQKTRMKRVLDLLGKSEEEITEAQLPPKEVELHFLRAELQEKSPKFLEGKTETEIQKFLVKQWNQNRYLSYKQELEARGIYIVWARSEDIENKPDKLKEIQARIESKHRADPEKAGIPVEVLIENDGRNDVFRKGLRQGIKDIRAATSPGRAKGERQDEGFSAYTEVKKDRQKTALRELATVASETAKTAAEIKLEEELQEARVIP